MKGIIDRFEGDVVVLEIDGITKDFPKTLFSRHAKEGDIVTMKNGKFVILKQETNELRKEIEGLMDDLFED